VRELPQDDPQDPSTDVGGGVQAGGDRLGISSASNPFKWIPVNRICFAITASSPAHCGSWMQ
jgi:hypothetical protein